MSADLIRCTKCGLNKTRAEFFPRDQTKMRRQPCKRCFAEYMKAKLDNDPEYHAAQLQNGRNYRRKMKGDPKKEQMRRAHKTIEGMIRRGEIQKASDLVCVDCGLPAAHYDHYLGYDEHHWRDVEPVCAKCHGQRAQDRGEMARSGRPKKSVDGTTAPG